eukprot:6299871-Prymnesium_polylepis.1
MYPQTVEHLNQSKRSSEERMATLSRQPKAPAEQKAWPLPAMPIQIPDPETSTYMHTREAGAKVPRRPQMNAPVRYEDLIGSKFTYGHKAMQVLSPLSDGSGRPAQRAQSAQPSPTRPKCARAPRRRPDARRRLFWLAGQRVGEEEAEDPRQADHDARRLPEGRALRGAEGDPVEAAVQARARVAAHAHRPCPHARAAAAAPAPDPFARVAAR